MKAIRRLRTFGGTSWLGRSIGFVHSRLSRYFGFGPSETATTRNWDEPYSQGSTATSWPDDILASCDPPNAHFYDDRLAELERGRLPVILVVAPGVVLHRSYPVKDWSPVIQGGERIRTHMVAQAIVATAEIYGVG